MGADATRIQPGGAGAGSIADRFDVGSVRSAIEGQGFMIVPDLIPSRDIVAMRNFWLAEFARSHRPAPMIWGPYLGEPNKVLYDESPSLSLYRSFDYLWNPPIDALTRRVALDLNCARNRIVEQDDRRGSIRHLRYHQPVSLRPRLDAYAPRYGAGPSSLAFYSAAYLSWRAFHRGRADAARSRWENGRYRCTCHARQRCVL